MLSRLITNFCRSVAVLGLAVLLAGRAFAADPEYLTAVADLPLAPGLVEEVGAGISFDKPEGRIVEAVARGDVAPAAITAFYRAALPGLGWQPLAGGASGSRWQRGGEILSVDIVDDRNPLVVRFSIAPN
ncbi:MAG: hypothetical protein HKN28_07945 [Alphaproteobacteria bacterium]|nr:hypothetical protein [Alphaproteobacteria bacterium]